jgi:mannosylglycoprotein endo-beta-mannosidase
LFIEGDVDQAKNLKLVLNTFEKLSGLKINFHKSEVYGFGSAKERVREFEQIFGCKEGSLPFKYLGIPMNTHKIANKDWGTVEERFQKNLSSWKGKLLSAGGRLVLINSVLSSLPMFMMSFLRIPKGVLKRLDYYRSRFYWQCDEHKKKYRLAKWSILRQPKSLGGLGIIDLEVQNVCLLSKWIFKLINEEGEWQMMLRNKYLGSKSLTQVTRRIGDSQFWSGLMEVKDLFLAKGRFKVNSGRQTRFWEDVWLGNDALMRSYPTLYNITRRKNVTVADVLNSVPLNMSFRRALVGGNLECWLRLVESIIPVQLNENNDVFVWNSNGKGGKFTVKAMYNELLREGRLPQKWVYWKAKVPCKIKIFIWYLCKGVTLTKDNLAKRKWKGDTKCCFCSSIESIQHLFFDCHMARSVWGVVHVTFGISPPLSFDHLCGSWLDNWTGKSRKLILIGIAALLWSIWLSRNEVVFNKCASKSFVQVVFRGTYWARSWAVLSKEGEGVFLKKVCQRMEVTTMEIFNQFGWTVRKRIQA